MNALRKIQKLEDDFRLQLAQIYNCDADDVPIDLDTLSIYNLEPSKRKDVLVRCCFKIYVCILIYLTLCC